MVTRDSGRRSASSAATTPGILPLAADCWRRSGGSRNMSSTKCGRSNCSRTRPRSVAGRERSCRSARQFHDGRSRDRVRARAIGSELRRSGGPAHPPPGRTAPATATSRRPCRASGGSSVAPPRAVVRRVRRSSGWVRCRQDGHRGRRRPAGRPVRRDLRRLVGMGRLARPSPHAARTVAGPVRCPGRLARRLPPLSAQRQADSLLAAVRSATEHGVEVELLPAHRRRLAVYAGTDTTATQPPQVRLPQLANAAPGHPAATEPTPTTRGDSQRPGAVSQHTAPLLQPRPQRDR